MHQKLLCFETTRKLMELAKQPYRPAPIIELKQEIETKTRTLERRASTCQIDPADISELTKMKLELDRLYVLWAEGEIQ